MELENNALFWQKLDTLYLGSDFILTKKKNEHHDSFSNLIYPVDYGYLKETQDDEKRIAVYMGTAAGDGIRAVVICADILKKEMDVKMLVDCTQQEELEILHFLNQTDFQKTVIVRRGNDLPHWASSL